jgi:hypothetical protein
MRFCHLAMKLKRFISITITAKWTVLVINCIHIDITCFMYVLDLRRKKLPIFSGVRVAQYLIICVVFCRSLFAILILAIVFFCPSTYLLLFTPFVSSHFS